MLGTVLFREASESQRQMILALASRLRVDEAAPRPADEVPAEVADLLATTSALPFELSSIRLVAGALTEIVACAEASSSAAEPSSLARHALRTCLARVQQCLLRTQTEFMQERRATLTGPTSEERYREFDEWLASDDGLQAYLAAYPVSVEDARRRSRDFALQFSQVLTRLRDDREDLVALGVPQSARLEAIDLGAGDLHAGQSVAILTFTSGERIVYKPRSLRLDVSYRRLVDAIRDSRPESTLRAAVAFDRGTYGWSEFVQESAVVDPYRAHRNVGELLGVLHALRATDMHHENLVMVDDTPVPVDLETLLAAIPPASGDLTAPGIVAISQSSTFVGLLPSLLATPGQEAKRGALDVGALGYAPGQESPFSSLVLHRPYTDEMHFTLEFLPHTAPPLLPPTDPARPLDPRDKVAEVVAGYTSFMTWLIENSTWLAAYVEKVFDGTEIRFVAVDTQRYANVLRLATHPDLQRRSHARDLALWRIALFREGTPSAMFESEHRQLRRGDIPRFVFASDRRDVFDAEGLVVRDALCRAPVEHVARGIRDMDLRQVRLNGWLIRLSFAAQLSTRSGESGFDFQLASSAATDPEAKLPDSLVRQLAQRVADAYVPASGDHPPTWVGARSSETPFQYWVPDEVPLELYAGSVGQAVNLFHAGRALGEDAWSEAAIEFFHRTAIRLLHSDTRWESLVRGAHAGVDSFVWAAGEIGAASGHADLEDLSRRLWARAIRTFDTGEIDVVKGSAGILLALCSQAESDPTGDLRALADQMASGLLRVVQNGGFTIQFSGFAHGVAGLYASLARWSGLSHGTGTSDLVSELLHRERSFRRLDGTIRFSTHETPEAKGWCHGTPGLLLSRSIVTRYLPDLTDDVRDEIAELKDRVRTSCFGGNPTLCHGDPGNLWILEDTALLTEDGALATAVAAARERYVRDALPAAVSDVNRHTITHSLMVGDGSALCFLLQESSSTMRSPLWFG